MPSSPFRSQWIRLRAGKRFLVKRLDKLDLATQLTLWPIAMIIGVATGYAVLGFRLAILYLEELFYGVDDVAIHSHAAHLPWWQLIIIPVAGGLVVGQILVRLSPTRRARSGSGARGTIAR